MQQIETKTYIEEKLPVRVVNELYGLAQRYQKKGAELFVFGSFADLRSKHTSDLDLGVIWTAGRSRPVFSELYRDVQELSTIRKIDLVDMEQVNEKFKARVMASPIFFLNENRVVDE